jgi:hypothetical protein
MKRIILFVTVGLFFTFFSGVETQQRRRAKPTQPIASRPELEKIVPIPKPVRQEMTDEERRRNYIGQKVILLKAAKVRDYWTGFSRLGRPREDELYKEYAGQIGVVINASGKSNQMMCVVQLDGSGEKVDLGVDFLGFFSEMELAKSYIGKSVWSIGREDLYRDFVPGIKRDHDQYFTVKNTQRLTVTRAEWGDHESGVYLWFKTVDGREGVVTGISLDVRLRGYSTLDDRFYFEDPLKQFPNLSKSIRQLIEDEVVAIGMTLKTAEVACKQTGLHVTGARVSASGAIATMFAGCDREFLVNKNGKVVEYVK